MVNGGYNVTTVNPTPKHLICPLCTYVLKDTIQTSRGERSCKECYTTSSINLQKGVCPIDGEPGTITFKDKYADKEISELEVYCKSKVNGCDWVGLLKVLSGHLKECKFVAPSSNEGLLVQCPWKCGHVVNGLLLDQHVNNCGRATAPNCCLFEALGCPYNGSVPLDAHMISSSIEHAKIMIPGVLMSSNTLKFFESQLKSQNTMVEDLLVKLDAESNKNINMKVEMKGVVEALLNEMTTQNEAVVNEMTLMKEKIQKLTVESQNQKTVELQLHEQIKKLEEKVDNKNNEPQGPGPAAIALTNTATTKSIDECKKKIVTCENNFTSLRSNVGELDLRQQLLENTCIGKRFLWKIDKLAHRIKQAQLNQVTALHSAPCFTKRFGYKFCARLYLNGDGMGKTTHISLFFVMMRSEYDTLLPWPFKEKVSFKLINHANENDSIKESFTPDGLSVSFKRPTREMNVAAGCPMFVTKERLENGNFIVDDSIFIETTVGNN